MLPNLGICAAVVSDVHWWLHPNPVLDQALESLFARAEGAEVIFAGDTFDLSLDRGPGSWSEALAQILRAQTVFVAAVKTHLLRGGSVTFLAGNHDSELMLPEARHVILREMGLPVDAALETARWFIRRSSVHIEHGHLYDSDNAPLHPLSPWTPRTEPLGVALMRRFVSANRAYQYAHANETTPIKGLLSAFRNFHFRAPWVIARYFGTAAALCVEAGPTRKRAAELERAAGDAHLAEYARQHEVEEEVLRAVLAHAPVPTHLHARATFMRLYFDRIIASALAVAAAVVAPLPLALPVVLLGGGYVALNVLRSGGRYNRQAELGLRAGAESIQRLTRASTVVFGHSHVVDDAPGYVNLGSFGFPARTGRSFVVVTRDGRVVRESL